jgi:hypothetical protein
MSQENVELWGAQVERLRAATSAQFDQEGAISDMAESGTRKSNWMSPRPLGWAWVA